MNISTGLGNVLLCAVTAGIFVWGVPLFGRDFLKFALMLTVRTLPNGAPRPFALGFYAIFSLVGVIGSLLILALGAASDEFEPAGRAILAGALLLDAVWLGRLIWRFAHGATIRI